MYWPEKETVVVADLHWGKVETFHQFGIPVPAALFDDDLHRLTDVLIATGAKRVIVLGDLIHGRRGLTPDVVGRLAEWRRRFPVEWVVVAGNHDRSLGQVAEAWDLAILTELKEGPFAFRHEPKFEEGAFTWCGHLHPTFTIARGFDSLRLPCFHLSAEVGIVPSFSAFTRGVKMEKRPGDRVFVIADAAILEV